MQLNNGIPSLVSTTRLLAGDPDSAGGLMWDDTTEVIPAINDAWLDLHEMARQRHAGTARKVTYRSATASTIYYSLPSDFVAFVNPFPVQLSADGVALTDTVVGDAKQIFLEAQDEEVALEAYYREVETAPRYVFIRGEQYGIVAPPTSTHAGTNTLRLTYEATTAELSEDSDSPSIPVQFHRLLCYKAAMILLASKSLPINDLAALAAPKHQLFLNWSRERMQQIEDQIPAAGRIRQSPATRMGTIRRT